MSFPAEDFDDRVREHVRVVAAAARRVCGRRYRTLIPDVREELDSGLRLRLAAETSEPDIYRLTLATALEIVQRHATPRRVRGSVISITRRAGHSEAAPAHAFDCPSPSDLAAWVIEQLSEADGDRIESHTADCESCAVLVADLEALHREAIDNLPYAMLGSPDRDEPSAWLRAAAVGLVVLSFAIALAAWHGPPSADPSAPSRAAIAGDLVPPDGAVLLEAPTTFSWKARTSATGYEVVVYDRDSTPLWRSTKITRNTLTLPPHLRFRFEPDRLYYWRFVILVGEERIRSPQYEFRISPPETPPG